MSEICVKGTEFVCLICSAKLDFKVLIVTMRCVCLVFCFAELFVSVV